MTTRSWARARPARSPPGSCRRTPTSAFSWSRTAAIRANSSSRPRSGQRSSVHGLVSSFSCFSCRFWSSFLCSFLRVSSLSLLFLCSSKLFSLVVSLLIKALLISLACSLHSTPPPFCKFPSFEPNWPPGSDPMYSFEASDPYNPQQTFMWKART